MVRTTRSVLALAVLLSAALGCGGGGNEAIHHPTPDAKTIVFTADGATNARTTPMNGEGSHLIEAGDIAVTVSDSSGVDGLRRVEVHIDPEKLVDGVATIDGKTNTASYLDQPELLEARSWFASGGKMEVVAETDGAITVRLTDIVLKPSSDAARGILRIDGSASGGKTM